MKRSIYTCIFYVLAALAFGFGMSLALPGCGGGDGGPELVKPAVAPAVSAKDSMDAYLQANHHSKAKVAKRSFR
jgi:hypothetical protein